MPDMAAPVPGLGEKVYHVVTAKPGHVAAYAACSLRHWLDVDRNGVEARDVVESLRCRRRSCAQRYAAADRE